jgi:hypothetical protein
MACAKKVLRYLQSRKKIPPQWCALDNALPGIINGCADASFADIPDTSLSSTCYFFLLNGGTISWRSTKTPLQVLNAAAGRLRLMAGPPPPTHWRVQLSPPPPCERHRVDDSVHPLGKQALQGGDNGTNRESTAAPALQGGEDETIPETPSPKQAATAVKQSKSDQTTDIRVIHMQCANPGCANPHARFAWTDEQQMELESRFGAGVPPPARCSCRAAAIPMPPRDRALRPSMSPTACHAPDQRFVGASHPL